MPDRSTEGREWVWLDPGYMGHMQWHPGLWGWKRSCQTSKGLCCLTLAFILQQQNTIADVEIGEFPHQIYAFQAGSWSEMGGRKTSSWEAGAREAVVMVEGQPTAWRVPGKEQRQGVATNGKCVFVGGVSGGGSWSGG